MTFPCRFAAGLLLLALFPSPALAAGEASRHDPRAGLTKDFLLRTVDDLFNTLAFAEATAVLLYSQTEASERPGANELDTERRALLEIYQQYVRWLKWQAGEFERELEYFFARHRTSGGWLARHEALAAGFLSRAAELDGRMARIEGERKRMAARIERLDKAVKERRLLVSADELELAREIWPRNNYRAFDTREAIYQELNEVEMSRLRSELNALVEQRDLLGALTDLEALEKGWLLLKAEELGHVLKIAKALASDDFTTLPSAIQNLIGTYEMGRKHTVARAESALQVTTRPASLGALREQEYFTRHHEQIGNRLERHREWLGAQIDSYRVDMVELMND